MFLNKDGEPKEVDELTSVELVKVSYNYRVWNTIMMGLRSIKSNNVSPCTTTKKMLDTLELCHKGLKVLKKIKLILIMIGY